MKSTAHYIEDYLSRIQKAVSQLSTESIDDVIQILLESARNNRKVFIFGNGGSAATASHFACDLSKNTMTPGAPRFRVIALTDNVPLITAWSNDTAYENVFSEQLSPLIEADDVVVGISCSGNSTNVINAMKVARQFNAKTIAFTGHTGGLLKDEVDLCVVAPSPQIELQEDIHLILEHCIVSAIRDELRRNFAFLSKEEVVVERPENRT